MTDPYLAQRLREAFADDPRVGELGVEVTFAGDKVFLHGVVATEERKAAITEVARSHCPEMDVHNEMVVEDLREPRSVENLR